MSDILSGQINIESFIGLTPKELKSPSSFAQFKEELEEELNEGLRLIANKWGVTLDNSYVISIDELEIEEDANNE